MKDKTQDLTGSPATLLAEAMAIIDRQEAALFKIASGRVNTRFLSRGDMMDLAEEALPKSLAEMVSITDQGRP